METKQKQQLSPSKGGGWQSFDVFWGWRLTLRRQHLVSECAWGVAIPILVVHYMIPHPQTHVMFLFEWNWSWNINPNIIVSQYFSLLPNCCASCVNFGMMIPSTFAWEEWVEWRGCEQNQVGDWQGGKGLRTFWLMKASVFWTGAQSRFA